MSSFILPWDDFNQAQAACSKVFFPGVPKGPSNTHENRTWVSCQSGPSGTLRHPSLSHITQVLETVTPQGMFPVHPLSSDTKASCPVYCSTDTQGLSEELGHSSFCHWPVWLWSSLFPFQFWFSPQWNARVGLVISGFTSNHGHHPSQLSHPLNDLTQWTWIWTNSGT